MTLKTLLTDPHEARNCANGDPEDWFPTGQGNAERAKILCDGCPLTTACLDWALTDNHPIYGYPQGILGGTTEDERAQLRKRAAA
jgi:WhiB family redox-sensing transcriptional regulator